MPCPWCILEGNIKQFSEAYDARQLLYYWAKKKIAPVGAVWKGHASSALVNDVLMDQIFFLLISYWVTTARHAIQQTKKHVPDPSSHVCLCVFLSLFCSLIVKILQKWKKMIHWLNDHKIDIIYCTFNKWEEEKHSLNIGVKITLIQIS